MEDPTPLEVAATLIQAIATAVALIGVSVTQAARWRTPSVPGPDAAIRAAMFDQDGDDDLVTELDDLLPEEHGTAAALGAVARTALAQVPALGPIATETLNLVIDARAAERRHAFDAMLVSEMNAVKERLDSLDAIVAYMTTNEFSANVTRARRLASETASEEKRRRLASAVASGGSWSSVSASERAQFQRFVAELEDLHVWLLHFFAGPRDWLQRHGRFGSVASYSIAGVSVALDAALGVPEQKWGSAVKQAAADLDRAGLATIPLTTTMTIDGVLQPRTSPKGRRFLDFISAVDHAAPDAPVDL